MVLWILLAPLLQSILSIGAPISSDITSNTMNSGDFTIATNHRSTLQIIWTSTTIIFASTWLCVHPNIPGYGSTKLQRWTIRVRLFLKALLFPDHFVERALNQWRGSYSLHSDMEMMVEAEQVRAAAEKLCVDGQKLSVEAYGPHSLKECEAKRDAALLWGRMSLLRSKLDQALPKDMKPKRGEGEEKVIDLTKEFHEEIESLREEAKVLWKELFGEAPQSSDAEPGLSMNPVDRGQVTWSLHHAHFIQMGGVAFKKEDPPVDAGVQQPAHHTMWFKSFVFWKFGDIKAFLDLKLTEDRLQDRSKADDLAKAIVVLQCLWFALQCVGRAASRLPLTLLEITCLAFIACNIAMSTFWWSKPLNVVWPEVVVRPDERRWRRQFMDVLSSSPTQRWGDFWKGMITCDVVRQIHPILGMDDNIDQFSSRFPDVYYYGGRFGVGIRQSLLPPISAIYGALHCISWYSAFPSATEQLLWRVSCIAPAVNALVVYAACRDICRSDSLATGRGAWPAIVAEYVAYAMVPIQLGARVVFIALPLLQLRDLAAPVHQTVVWSDFLPHI